MQIVEVARIKINSTTLRVQVQSHVSKQHPDNNLTELDTAGLRRSCLHNGHTVRSKGRPGPAGASGGRLTI